AHAIAELGQAEQVGQWRSLDPQSRRRRDPQLLDALGPADGEFHRDPAPQAVAAEVDLVQAEGVQQLEVVEGHVGDGVDALAAAAGQEHTGPEADLLEEVLHRTLPALARSFGKTSRASSSMLIRPCSCDSEPTWQPVRIVPAPSSFW